MRSMADQLLQERRTFPPYQGKVEICHLLEPFKGFPGISDDKEAACIPAVRQVVASAHPGILRPELCDRVES